MSIGSTPPEESPLRLPLKTPNVRSTYPTFLPDGIRFLYLRRVLNDDSASGVYLATLDEPVGRKLLSDISSAAYSPPAGSSGKAHLLFLRDNVLMAQPVQEGDLQFVGDAYGVAAGVSTTSNSSQVAATVSQDGTLIYRSGTSRRRSNSPGLTARVRNWAKRAEKVTGWCSAFS